MNPEDKHLADKMKGILVSTMARATRHGVNGNSFVATFKTAEEAHAIDASIGLLQWIFCENTDDLKVAPKNSPLIVRPKRISTRRKGIFFPVLSQDVRSFIIELKREARRRGERFPDVVDNFQHFAKEFGVELKPQVEADIVAWKRRSKITSITQQVCMWEAKLRKQRGE